MEVINANEKLLCNSEVLHFLRELKENDKKLMKLQKNLATVAYETTKYLEDVRVPTTQQPDQVRQLLLALKSFRLTKSEKLQIVNQRPETVLELQLLIEENEERFSEQALEQILTIVEQSFPVAATTDSSDETMDV
jgi:DNA-directed RNA polymerase subunit F